MRRRTALHVMAGALAWPLQAQAQQRVYRVGFLRNGMPPRSFIEGLRQGLRELGYVEGQNVSIDYELAESVDQLPAAAADLVRRKVDVIIASGTPPIAAAKNATRTIPIIFVASVDPVATGMIASLARPGGNVTGYSGLHADLMGKRLELLREVLPGPARVAVLSAVMNPGSAEYIRQAALAAPALGLDLQIVPIRDAGDFDRAFVETTGASAILQLDDVIFTSNRRQVVDLALQRRLPVMYPYREFVEAGGLIAYGPNLPDQYRRAATYVDKLLKGANPADLPVEQPTTFELVVNLKTAKALDLVIPQSLLARADEVIE